VQRRVLEGGSKIARKKGGNLFGARWTRQAKPGRRWAAVKSGGCQGIWGSGGVNHSSSATCQSGPQALGAHDASPLLLWLRLEAKSERALGLGATVGVLGTGVPRLACLRPMAWHLHRPGMAHLHQPPSSPSRGAKPREAVSLRTSGGSNFTDNSQVPREGPSLARRVAPRPPEGAAQ
jgi:hypothetical protein